MDRYVLFFHAASFFNLHTQDEIGTLNLVRAVVPLGDGRGCNARYVEHAKSTAWGAGFHVRRTCTADAYRFDLGVDGVPSRENGKEIWVIAKQVV